MRNWTITFFFSRSGLLLGWGGRRLLVVVLLIRCHRVDRCDVRIYRSVRLGGRLTRKDAFNLLLVLGDAVIQVLGLATFLDGLFARLLVVDDLVVQDADVLFEVSI